VPLGYLVVGLSKAVECLVSRDVVWQSDMTAEGIAATTDLGDGCVIVVLYLGVQPLVEICYFNLSMILYFRPKGQ